MHLQRILALLIMTAIVGCAPYATYPPHDKTVYLSSPTFAPFPELMARGVRAGQEQFEDPNELILNLPEGSTTVLYETVIDKLGEGQAMTDPEQRAYHVIEVRARGAQASVDVICPRSDGLYSLMTIDFDHDVIHGYRITNKRVWRIHVDAPPPHYAPPTDKSDDALASQTVAPRATP